MENGRKKVVLYDATGAVLEMSEQVEEKDLPKPVFDAIHSHRRAIFVSAMKVTRKGGVEYQITCAAAARPRWSQRRTARSSASNSAPARFGYRAGVIGFASTASFTFKS